jgi:hypothetical protein
VITTANGTTVNNLKDLRSQLEGKVAGDTISLTVNRSGQTLNVNVTLENAPEPLVERPNPFPELDGIEKGDLFSHIMGGQFNLTDENGNPITVHVNVGTVASKTDNSLTITPNDGGANETYQVTDNTAGKALLSRLENGAEVTVVTVGNSTEARIIAPGGGLGFGLPGMGGLGIEKHRFDFDIEGLKDRLRQFKEGTGTVPMEKMPPLQPGQSIQ